MSSIYKTFTGHTIDLDKLVVITQAKAAYSDNYGYYCCVSFSMYFQSLIKPVIYERALNSTEYEEEENNVDVEGRIVTVRPHINRPQHNRPRNLKRENGRPLCEINLDKQIQEIIDAWENWKRNVNINSARFIN